MSGRTVLPPWEEALVRAREQALEDVAVSGGTEVVFVCAERPGLATGFTDAVQERAHKRRFLTAEVPLFGDRGFDALDGLVRSILRGLGAPFAAREERGVRALLDAFLERRGERAHGAFESAAEREGAYGDLTELCLAYLDAARGPRREAARIDAWISGTELRRADGDGAAALTPRTAKRALAELSRVVRALGHRGILVVFPGAEVLTRLPDARRRDTYTVLRELIDNVDGGRGLVATALLVVGARPLFEGTRSLAQLPPLAMRIGAAGSRAGLVPPHRTLIELAPSDEEPGELPEVRPPDEASAPALRALLRSAHGLPPLEALPSLSVGFERIDETIDRLFEHSAMQGSVFTLLTGAYGSGKTHLLLHLAERALADKRPVLRLAVEQLDTDLGNPQRHLRRMLEDATLPLPGRPSLIDLLTQWTRRPAQLRKVVAALEALAAEEGEVAPIATRLLSLASRDESPRAAVEGLLGASDLTEKPPSPGNRGAAYARLLLWVALLERVEGLRGPVLLVDEAENLYRGGLSRAERRTALRSLAFYCGGTIPSACVILAITPDAVDELRAESEQLLAELEDQKTALAWEDASMLARRLRSAKPVHVPVLPESATAELADRVRKTHQKARGRARDAGFDAFVASLGKTSPREVVRRTLDRLETSWWERLAGRSANHTAAILDDLAQDGRAARIDGSIGRGDDRDLAADVRRADHDATPVLRHHGPVASEKRSVIEDHRAAVGREHRRRVQPVVAPSAHDDDGSGLRGDRRPAAHGDADEREATAGYRDDRVGRVGADVHDHHRAAADQRQALRLLHLVHVAPGHEHERQRDEPPGDGHRRKRREGPPVRGPSRRVLG